MPRRTLTFLLTALLIAGCASTTANTAPITPGGGGGASQAGPGGGEGTTTQATPENSKNLIQVASTTPTRTGRSCPW
jgi:hypothetical protein